MHTGVTETNQSYVVFVAPLQPKQNSAAVRYPLEADCARCHIKTSVHLPLHPANAAARRPDEHSSYWKGITNAGNGSKPCFPAGSARWAAISGLIVSVIVKIVIILIPLDSDCGVSDLFRAQSHRFMQLRVGPQRNGPGADPAVCRRYSNCCSKITRPSSSDKWLFSIGPMLSFLAPLRFAAWAVVPFFRQMALTKCGREPAVHPDDYLAVRLVASSRAGRATPNTPFFGAMRSSAQTISSGNRHVRCPRDCGIRVSGKPELYEIVAAQAKGIAEVPIFSWNWFTLFPVFLVYPDFRRGRNQPRPFDVAEGESEIVAGFHVEYSGFRFRPHFPGRVHFL